MLSFGFHRSPLLCAFVRLCLLCILFELCFYLWSIACFCKNLMFNISFGCCRHSVSNTFVQLTEGRSARDQPKQPPAKKKSSCEEGPGQSALQSAYHNPQLDETELKQTAAGESSDALEGFKSTFHILSIDRCWLIGSLEEALKVRAIGATFLLFVHNRLHLHLLRSSFRSSECAFRKRCRRRIAMSIREQVKSKSRVSCKVETNRTRHRQCWSSRMTLEVGCSHSMLRCLCYKQALKLHTASLITSPSIFLSRVLGNLVSKGSKTHQ